MKIGSSGNTQAEDYLNPISQRESILATQLNEYATVGPNNSKVHLTYYSYERAHTNRECIQTFIDYSIWKHANAFGVCLCEVTMFPMYTG